MGKHAHQARSVKFWSEPSSIVKLFMQLQIKRTFNDALFAGTLRVKFGHIGETSVCFSVS